MSKYLNRPALTSGQGEEIYPLLDAALKLPFGKAIVHKCSKSRANYLSRTLNGERYRNAIESIAAYLPTEPLYGKGLYYHLVIEAFDKGLLIANVKAPPATLTWAIIQCAATKKPVDVSAYNPLTVKSRLCKLRERHEEVKKIFLEGNTIKYAIVNAEELVIVDIDIGTNTVPGPTREQRTKTR